MTHLLIFLGLATVLVTAACRQDQNKSADPESQIQSTEIQSDTIDKADTLVEVDKDIVINQLNRIELEKTLDDRSDLSEFLQSRNLKRDKDEYLLNFNYPYLDQSVDPKFEAFNTYLASEIVNAEAVSAQILEDRELLCDSLRTQTYREKRFIEYKIYNTQMRMLSLLFYKENFYSGAIKPAFSYQTVNFDLQQQKRLMYEDVFVKDSEEGVYFLINAAIEKAIDSGQLHYDCFPLSKEDFGYYKHNFVIDAESLTYYFDDCSICPSYIGSYSIGVPLVKLIPYLNTFSKTQFII